MTTPAPPLISIVIPVYNVERFLAATLDSILAQSEPRWECVMVDDGSPDSSAAVAQTYVDRDSRFQLFRQANAGPSFARNYGQTKAHPQSQFITFMDSDDMWTPTALADLLAALEREPDKFAASGLAEYVDSEGRVNDPGERARVMRQRLSAEPTGLRLLRKEEPTGFASLCIGSDQFPPGVILGRRTFYNKVGGFDTTVQGCEDWELLVRLSRHGDMAFLDKLVLFYRRHSSNYGTSSFVARQTWRVRCLVYHSLENNARQRQIVRWAWKYSNRHAARSLLKSAARELRTFDLKAGLLLVAKSVSALLRSLRAAPQPQVQ